METYKFIADEAELKWFWDYGVPPLRREEIYFVSLSCRNKTLTEEEREHFKCGRSEMFSKQQIRHDNYESFLQHIKRFEVRRDAYLTKAGLEYPQKSLVVYWNISPINAYNAMTDQMKYLTEIMTSLTDSAIKNSQGGIDEAFYKIRKSFDSCQSLFARNFGTKYWIDFDIDCENISTDDYKRIYDVFGSRFPKGNVMFVQTSGGIHCFLKKEGLKMNPQVLCDEIMTILKDKGLKEVCRNSNEMCALPGTFQYEDHIVRVLNKEDFTLEMKFEHGKEVS